MQPRSHGFGSGGQGRARDVQLFSRGGGCNRGRQDGDTGGESCDENHIGSPTVLPFLRYHVSFPAFSMCFFWLSFRLARYSQVQLTGSR